MDIRISFKDDVLARYGNQLAAVGAGGAEAALQRAIRHTGRKARTQVIRALTQQTGLRRATLVRAVRDVSSEAATLSLILCTQGGDIRLKHFRVRETRKGVSAAPWNKRTVFAGTFMKAGWFRSGRVVKPNWNGQVFSRLAAKTETGRDKFKLERSGLFIPTEMLQGQSAQAWRMVIQRDLIPRIGNELSRLLPG